MTAAAKTALSVRTTTAKVLQFGASRTGGINWRVDLTGRCERSVTVDHYGKGENHEVGAGLTMEVPCRNCAACLRQRQWRWFNRALIEMHRSSRTWFGTLTLRPEARAHFKNVARLKYKVGDLDALSDVQQFQRLVNAIGVELTAMLKRLRESTGAQLRYMAVAEPHKDGEPHLHMLVHEVNAETHVSWEKLTWRHRHGSEPLEERRAIAQWPCGFSKWKLVEDQRQAAYVCKYLSKNALARVRASMRYGKIVSYDPKNEVL